MLLCWVQEALEDDLEAVAVEAASTIEFPIGARHCCLDGRRRGGWGGVGAARGGAARRPATQGGDTRWPREGSHTLQSAPSPERCSPICAALVAHSQPLQSAPS